jgi:hypothetical protein
MSPGSHIRPHSRDRDPYSTASTTASHFHQRSGYYEGSSRRDRSSPEPPLQAGNNPNWSYPSRGELRHPCNAHSPISGTSESYYEVPRAPTSIAVQLAPIFDQLVNAVAEQRLVHRASMDQQRELLRYVRDFHDWLGDDAEERHRELRNLSARIDSLLGYVAETVHEGDLSPEIPSPVPNNPQDVDTERPFGVRPNTRAQWCYPPGFVPIQFIPYENSSLSSPRRPP